jgi:pantetheine-phosphate adenylyltransferase
MRIAICPGSYDPPTYGHLNIVRRSAGLFDKVIVAVMVNPDKQNWFTPEERVEMLRAITADISNVEVEAHSGLVAEYAREKKACALVKGLRAVTDFEYEFQMALINKKLNEELETMFITTDAQFMYLSSSTVREIASFGGELTDFVPSQIETAIKVRMAKEG